MQKEIYFAIIFDMTLHIIIQWLQMRTEGGKDGGKEEKEGEEEEEEEREEHIETERQ